MELLFGATMWFSLAALPIVGLYLFVSRIHPRSYDESTFNAARWTSVRVGALHALIVALAFSGVRAEFNELQETVDNEALAIEQLYRGLDGFDDDLARKTQADVATYVRLVISEEWPSMASGSPLEEADRLVDRIYTQIIELGDSTDSRGRASALQDDINDIENARGQRSFDIVEPISPLFWLVAVVGFAFTVACFFVFPPTTSTVLFLAMFAGMNGLIAYSIQSFAHPFANEYGVKPTALIAVVDRNHM